MTPRSGYIYAVGAVGMPLVKIGMTTHEPEAYYAHMQTYSPIRVYFIGSVRVEGCLGAIEKSLHEHLAALRERGEWFEMSLTQPVLQRLVDDAMQAQPSPRKTKRYYTYSGNLGQDIKAIRTAHNLTQVVMATVLGYDANYIARLERSGTSKEVLPGSQKIAERLKKIFPEKKSPQPKKTP